MTAVVGGCSNGVEAGRGDWSFVVGDAGDSFESEPSRSEAISTVTVILSREQRLGAL